MIGFSNSKTAGSDGFGADAKRASIAVSRPVIAYC